MMRFPKLSTQQAQMRRLGRFGGVAAILAGSAVAMVLMWPKSSVNLAGNVTYPADLRKQYSAIVQAVHAFETRQSNLQAQVVSVHDLNSQLSRIQIDATSGQFAVAEADITSLKQALANWNFELSGGTKVAAATQPQSTSGLYLPILLYHYPPANFEQQLEHLDKAGYTTIDLDQALAGMQGAALPPKPVVITFDDGFEAQMSAYNQLKQHHMKATFYIINAGEASRWCIGAGRRYGDPLQPPSGCGDTYLSWDQIKEMDKSGLITIAGHTVNHRDLVTLSEADQRFEIVTGKAMLEAELGHSVRHFAYPYGAFNATSIALVQEAGYVTAVTTQPGAFQPAGSNFTLRRVRDAMVLP